MKIVEWKEIDILKDIGCYCVFTIDDMNNVRLSLGFPQRVGEFIEEDDSTEPYIYGSFSDLLDKFTTGDVLGKGNRVANYFLILYKISNKWKPYRWFTMNRNNVKWCSGDLSNGGKIYENS